MQRGGTHGAQRDGGGASAGLEKAAAPLEAAGAAAAPSAGSGGCSGATAAASAGLARATPRSHARWCGASCHSRRRGVKQLSVVAGAKPRA